MKWAEHVFDSGIKNATIRSVRLGREDYGILTAYVDLDYGGSYQSFGGFCLDVYNQKTKTRAFSGAAGLFISRVLEVVGEDAWEKLPGRPVRVDADHTRVHRLGHFLEDKWFDPKAEFAEMTKL